MYWAKRSLRKNVPMYLEVKKTVAAVKAITSQIEALQETEVKNKEDVALQAASDTKQHRKNKEEHKWHTLLN